MQKVTLISITLLLCLWTVSSLDVAMRCQRCSSCSSGYCHRVNIESYSSSLRYCTANCSLQTFFSNVGKCNNDFWGDYCSTGLCSRSINFKDCIGYQYCPKKLLAFVTCLRGKVTFDWFTHKTVKYEDSCPFIFGSVYQEPCSGGDSDGNGCSCCRTVKFYGASLNIWGTNCIKSGPFYSARFAIKRVIDRINAL